MFNKYNVKEIKARADKIVENNKVFTKKVKNINGDTYTFYNYHVSVKSIFDEHQAHFIRGLMIINDDFISPGLIKFFDMEQMEASHIANIVIPESTITIKYDGSLIIPYVYKGEIKLRTQQSIENNLIDLANSLLEKQPELKEEILKYWKMGKVLCMELISPDNKIIVEYNESKLVPITISDLDTIEPYPSAIIENNYKDLTDMISGIQKPNIEGYVVYHNGIPVKFKNEWYKYIHNLTMTQFTDLFKIAISNCIQDFELISNVNVFMYLSELKNKAEITINEKYKIYQEYTTEEFLKLDKKEYFIKINNVDDKYIKALLSETYLKNTVYSKEELLNYIVSKLKNIKAIQTYFNIEKVYNAFQLTQLTNINTVK